MRIVLRVICVDPHPVVSAGLSALGRDEGDLEFVGSAATAEEAFRVIDDLRPDLVVLDPDLLGPDGLSLCRRVKTAAPDTRVVFYTAGAFAQGTSVMARVAGADGLLDKSTPPAVLFEKLREIGRGGVVLPPLKATELEAAALRVEPDDLAVLAMLADRTSPAEVADTLRMDRRGLTRRIERMLPRLGSARRFAA